MGFQGIEIAEALALVVIVVALLWPRLTPWRLGHPSLFWTAVGGVCGLTAGALAVVMTGDVFPDRFEPLGRGILLVGVVCGGLLLALRKLSSA